MERTFAMMKPDALARGYQGEMLHRIVRAKFKVVALELRLLDRAFLEQFYAEHRERPFFPAMVERMQGQEVIGLILEGEEAVSRFRALIGATDPKKAAPGTLRSDYGIDLDQNSIHGSDAVGSAAREIGLFFGSKVG